MRVQVLSFGFKYGLPADAELVLDVRGLPNPFYVPELKPLCGLDAPVQRYVLEHPQTQTYLQTAWPLVTATLQLAKLRQCAHYTIAVGCTGGRHRSVAIAQELARRLAEAGYPCACAHRCMTRDTQKGGT